MHETADRDLEAAEAALFASALAYAEALAADPVDSTGDPEAARKARNHLRESAWAYALARSWRLWGRSLGGTARSSTHPAP